MAGNGFLAGIGISAATAEVVRPHELSAFVANPMLAVVLVAALAALASFVREIEARERSGAPSFTAVTGLAALVRKAIVGAFVATMVVYVAISYGWTTAQSILGVGIGAFFGLELVELFWVLAKRRLSSAVAPSEK